jgi:hypothetical protein
MKQTLGLILLLLVSPFPVFSSPLSTGDNLPELTLVDQYGNPHSLSEVHTILFAPDKKAAALAHQLLQHRNRAEMAAQGILLISDISRMPGFVTRMFAIPTMREYPYLVLLGYQTDETAWVPRRESTLTLLYIHSGRISHIDYADTLESLTSKMELASDVKDETGD